MPQANLSRRKFLSQSSRALALGLLASAVELSAFKALAQTIAPLQSYYRMPDMSEGNILRFKAGLRPLRKSGIRIEKEERFGKTMVHNYGHSGGGFTLAWGSAEAAVNKIMHLTKEPIAVIGGGVIGLSTAHQLRAAGFPVTIYAEKLAPEGITSELAGAQWSPSHVAPGLDPQLYQQILKTSFDRYKEFEGSHYGVSMRNNVIVDGGHDDLMDLDVRGLPDHYHVDKLPFEGLDMGANIYPNWLIQPPIYLPALMQKLRLWDVQFVKKAFQATDDQGSTSTSISELKENIVFNCAGLGAKRFINDDDLMPIRGRLIHMNPNPDLDYLLLFKKYLFPRQDAMVLGGTFDEGQYDLSFNPEEYLNILGYHREFWRLPKVDRLRPDIPYQAISYDLDRRTDTSLLDR